VSETSTSTEGSRERSLDGSRSEGSLCQESVQKRADLITFFSLWSPAL